MDLLLIPFPVSPQVSATKAIETGIILLIELYFLWDNQRSLIFALLISWFQNLVQNNGSYCLIMDLLSNLCKTYFLCSQSVTNTYLFLEPWFLASVKISKTAPGLLSIIVNILYGLIYLSALLKKRGTWYLGTSLQLLIPL